MRRLTLFLLLLTLAAAPAGATIIGPWISLVPLDGIITGAPGDSVGWGFTIHGDDTNWVTITDVLIVNESSPLGVFFQYAGINSGPVDFAIPPGTDWIQNFSLALNEGLGAYQIDPGTSNGVETSGSFQITYDLYADDPLLCGCSPLNSSPLELYLAHDDSDPSPPSRAQFEVDVQAVPEPSTIFTIVSGLLLGVGALYRKRRPPQRRSGSNNSTGLPSGSSI